MAHRLRALAAALAAAATLTPLVSAPPATADPDILDAPPGVGEVVWRQLGLSDRLTLTGADEPNDVSIPVPSGVTAVTLSGQIGAAANVTNGRVEVYDGAGQALGTILLPAEATTTPFQLDTSTAQVADGAVKLSFILREDDSPINTCSPVPSVSLWQLSSTFSGESPHPSTIADFLPAHLERITIRVGSEPNPDIQQAAVSLVATLTHRYRPIPVLIDVDTAPTGPPPLSGATTRVIDIRTADRPGVAVENGGTPAATLAVFGSGPELQRQIELFAADGRSALTQSASTSVTSAATEIPTSTETLTFDQLGADRQVSVLHAATMYAGFDAAAFGVGAIQRAKVRLHARYTPVVDSSGSVVIRTGDTVLATERLDESGVLDTVLTIPAEAITSNVGLVFDLRYFPQRDCTPLSDRLFFALDGTSSVTVERGTHTRGGFPVLPMAFTPGFNVSVDRPDQIRYAARVINLLGRDTTVALRPQVRSLEDAAASGNGLLAVTTGGALGRLGLNPPLTPGERDELTVDSAFRTTAVDPNGPIGFIQAFTQNGGTILDIQTTGADDLVDRTLDFISGLDRQWGSLTGDIVATGPTGQTVNLALREGDWIEPQVTPNEVWKWWLGITVAVGVAAAAAMAGVLIRRRRRSATPTGL